MAGNFQLARQQKGWLSKASKSISSSATRKIAQKNFKETIKYSFKLFGKTATRVMFPSSLGDQLSL